MVQCVQARPGRTSGATVPIVWGRQGGRSVVQNGASHTSSHRGLGRTKIRLCGRLLSDPAEICRTRPSRRRADLEGVRVCHPALAGVGNPTLTNQEAVHVLHYYGWKLIWVGRFNLETK